MSSTKKILLAAALLLPGLSAYAVDAVTTCPKNFRVLSEDDKARILHFTQKKGETCPMHTHPHIAAYVIKPSQLSYKMADGSVKPGPKLKKGDAFMRPPTEHEHLPSMSGEAEAIIVEFKQ